jgi:uncharacterized protein DUF6519/centrosomal CEP192-like protein
MSFDNSRFTFNPWNDYFGVVMQQGRVQLDSDWNEWLAEFARRIQAGTLDILGLAGVPSSTPYGFKINAFQDASGNHITIGAGRIYVDGLLAENHGLVAQAQWDSTLAEWSGAPPRASEFDIDYTSQPYLPGATISGNGPFLVYLDVWQREVTPLEDSKLVDQAVGVDTTGRLQTVWQVKLLNISSGVTCSTVIDLQDLIQPSLSLLTNGVVPTPSSGPCSLSPAAGYTGLENQLYRVEIHQGGSTTSTPPATFKWSRENASVATSVNSISTVTNSIGVTASRLTVRSLGRDQVLGFNPGDWIEIFDDFLELNAPVLNGQAQPGELHRIDSIDSAAKTITLDSTVSPVTFPVNSNNQPDPGRHTRIHRWDEAGTVFQSDGATVWANLDAAGSTGDILVPPPGTALILENGITVAFDLGPSGSSIAPWNSSATYSGTAPASVVTFLGGTWVAVAPVTGTAPGVTSGQWEQIAFGTGDFWIFAARTADGSVEPLTTAHPFGIQHHYCRLGTVDFTAKPPQVGDCRRLFPPLANPCIHVTNVLLAGAQLLNDTTVTVQSLSSGISVICDLPVDPAIITQPAAQSNDPVCYVTANLPVPVSPPAGGFNPFILSATVTVVSNTITWTPTAAARTALINQVSPGSLPLLARLRLKGNCVWAKDNPNVYLNGAVAGAPGTAGGKQTNLQLPSGDGRRSADFDMWFWLISQPVVTLSATAVNFSTPQLVGSPSSSQSVTLTNNSTITPLTFPGTGISVSGASAADFTVTNTCGTTVAAGASCTISVTFNPKAAGTRAAQINITESADSSPLVIALTGTGIQPLVSASVTSLVFGVQTVSTTSAPQTITLTNPGTSQLTITSIAIEGTDYALTNTCGGSLQPGQQCTISVQFEPAAAGTRSAQLQIQTNASNVAGGTVLIPLTGTGVAGLPGVTGSPTSLAFGTVLTTSSLSKEVTLTSTGNVPLTITGMQIIGSNASSYSQSNTCAGSIQPTQQCNITVVFKPVTTGALTAQLQISHNALGSPLTIPLSGTGSLPKSTAKDLADGGGKHTLIEKIQKETDTVVSLKPSVSPEISTGAPSQAATKTAFISPEERPSVGP